MGGWIDDIVGGLIAAVVNTVTATTMWALTWVLDLLSATVFHTPDVAALPQVRFVSGQAQMVVNACMALAVTVAGIRAMARGGAVEERYTIKEMLPRMLLGFVAANFATPLVSFVIEAANALTVALTVQVSSGNSFDELRRVVVDTASSPQQAIAVLVVRELALFLLVALLFTWLGRIAVLLLLAGVAPIGLACHGFAATEPVAQLWWRSLAGALATQILQATTLHIAVAVLLTPGANLPALGLPNDPTGLLNVLIAAFVLWIVIRIPTWLSRQLGLSQNRAASTLGHIVRIVLIQQAMRAVGVAVGGRRLAGRVAGVRAPATHLHQHAGNLHQHLHVRPGRDGRRPGPRPTGGDDRPPRWVNATVGRPGARGGARPHGGRQALAIGPGPSVRQAGTTASGQGGGPPRPVPQPPGAIPLRRPRWHAYYARPSATGWPTEPQRRRSGNGWPTQPGGSSAAGPAAARPAGIGWPATPTGSRRGSGTGWPSTPRQVPRVTSRRGGHNGQ